MINDRVNERMNISSKTGKNGEDQISSKTGWGREGEATYREVEEVDDGPGHAGGAAEDGEHEEPGEEKDEYVGAPDAGVHEPLRVLVQIRWRHRLHVELRHRPRRVCSPFELCLRVQGKGKERSASDGEAKSSYD